MITPNERAAVVEQLKRDRVLVVILSEIIHDLLIGRSDAIREDVTHRAKEGEAIARGVLPIPERHKDA